MILVMKGPSSSPVVITVEREIIHSDCINHQFRSVTKSCLTLQLKGLYPTRLLCAFEKEGRDTDDIPL